MLFSLNITRYRFRLGDTGPLFGRLPLVICRIGPADIRYLFLLPCLDAINRQVMKEFKESWWWFKGGPPDNQGNSSLHDLGYFMKLGAQKGVSIVKGYFQHLKDVYRLERDHRMYDPLQRSWWKRRFWKPWKSETQKQWGIFIVLHSAKLSKEKDIEEMKYIKRWVSATIASYPTSIE